MDKRQESIIQAIKDFCPSQWTTQRAKDPDFATKTVVSYFSEDEYAEGVMYGKVAYASVLGGGLWATNKRMIFIGISFNLFGKDNVIFKDFSYQQIVSIQQTSNQELDIKLTDANISISGIKKDYNVIKFVDLIRSKVNLFSQENVSVPSISDELEKLALLRGKNLLSEEEFVAAKKRLLGI